MAGSILCDVASGFYPDPALHFDAHPLFLCNTSEI